MKTKALNSDFLMILTAVIWGFTFVAQKVGMDYIGPFLFSGLRFALGALVILPFLCQALKKEKKKDNKPILTKNILFGGFFVGLVLTTALNLQQVGLMFTSVTHSGFITGLYVIIVPLIGIFLKHKTGLGTWIGAVFAVIGILLLSVNADYEMSSGDLLQLAGAFIWAIHVLLVGHFVSKFNAILLAFIQFVVCAILSLILAIIFEKINLLSIYHAVPSLLYGGILAAGVGFTLQVIAQKNALPSHAAIILSLESVFSAIAGALILNEVLPLKGYIGCGLMFIGMLISQLYPYKKLKKMARLRRIRKIK